jgi:hypothetical protein
MSVMAAIILLTGMSVTADADQRRNRNNRRDDRDQRRYRVNEREAKNLVKRIENGADRFKRSLDRALDRSRIDGTRQEDNINQFVKDFEEATNRLRDRVNDNNRAEARDAEEVLSRGRTIDGFMRRHRLDSRAENDWSRLRGDLNTLARLYRINARWR